MKTLTLSLVFAAFFVPPGPTPGVLGDWRTPTGSVVRIEPCGGAVCLRIVQLSAAAPSTIDRQNPDTALRSRKLCGLTVGTGFHQDDPTHLSGGRLYDPQSGHTYRGTVTATGDSLLLHGYLGISIFGRSETWQRTPAVTPCST
jgi:uncharacterized protein (DUF2147 family)